MASVQVEISASYPRSNQTLRDNALRIAVSYVGWLTIFFVSGWISRTLIPKVRTLRSKDQMFWQLSMVRAVCGLSTLWAAYIVFVDGRIARDHTLASTDESWMFVSILTAFFIFEELTLIYFDIKYHTFSKELHMHHFFCLNGFFLAAYYNCAHYYALRVFILEASTPFSCICWCLLKLKLERTSIWKINQWILIYVFHLRTIYELWWWYEMIKDWDQLKQNVPWVYTINMLIGAILVTFWLTPYWTYKKTAQFFNPIDWNSEKDKVKKNDEFSKAS